MRVAWFGPLPPVRSGIAADNAELLPLLDRDFAIDRFDEPRAHDFVWMQRRAPYDLTVFQLGNSSYHDFVWAYLAAYPGLVVLHDPKLHHARARHLLNRERFDDYRNEFRYDHPDAPADFPEYAIAGLGGSIYYLWSMLPVVINTARMIAVTNERVAADLREQHPHAAIETIRLGKTAVDAGDATRRAARAQLRIDDAAVVFAAFGKLTSEKRIPVIVKAFAAAIREGQLPASARLLLVGEVDPASTLSADVAQSGAAERIHITGYVQDDKVGGYLAAADVCLCLRWPTASAAPAAWLHCLAARRATVMSDLAHLVDIPASVARRVDLLDEERSLRRAMDELASDRSARERLAEHGYQYWAAHHTMARSADDYRRVIRAASARPAPAPADLPVHFMNDYSARARDIMRRFGVNPGLL